MRAPELKCPVDSNMAPHPTTTVATTSTTVAQLQQQLNIQSVALYVTQHPLYAIGTSTLTAQSLVQPLLEGVPAL